MKVLFTPEVEDDLFELISLLVDKGYLGTYDFVVSYVEDLIFDIQANIHTKFKKQAPSYFDRFGTNMSYISYQKKSNTTWYIFFSIIDDTYLIKYITNNHVVAHHL